jgi:hypothetical protein
MAVEVAAGAARASRNAMTRNAEASGVDASLSASTAATTAASVVRRFPAVASSTCQNAASSATLVRWPASEKLRLIRLLRGWLPSRRSR